MSLIPSYKPKDLEKILLKNSFILKRQTGSHRTYHNPQNKAVVVVAFHSKDIPTGTLRSIIKQSKLSIETFIK
jgi:predicted RNA binding protein YcfA (HicA-like mRNA interferase family)